MKRYFANAGVALLIAFVAACNLDVPSPSALSPSDSVIRAFVVLADSMSRAAGDSSVAATYASARDTYLTNKNLTVVDITLDGSSAKYYATALETIGTISCAPDLVPCTGAYSLRSVTAFPISDPRRIITLSMTTLGSKLLLTSFTYVDGKGGLFRGDGSGASIDVQTGTAACFPIDSRCTLKPYLVSVASLLQPASLPARTTATGTHTLAVAGQTVVGLSYDAR